MTLVPGDPASLSACAAVARSVAEQLGGRATGVRTASGLLGEGWTGRTSAATRRRAADLAAATDACAAQLDTLGRVLQDHATDLADLVARARAVEERARAAGLDVRDGRVEVGWGVSGTADAQHDRREARGARGAAGRARPRARPAPAPSRLGPRGAARLDDVRCPIFRTGCAVDERIAEPTTERTPRCD